MFSMQHHFIFQSSRHRKIQSLALLLCLVTCVLVSAQATRRTSVQDFRLTIHRQYPSEKCTSGYLAINGVITSYTVERPWKDNQENISSIPSGTYDGRLRYDHSDRWRVELIDVPGRTNVQIHIGNQPDQSKGCILVGKKLNPDLCSLQQSGLAYRDLKKAFYGTETPSATPNKNIVVEVVGSKDDP
jgi:hypothetical protein